MNMKKFLSKLFAWIGECAVCEQAMYEALYDARIKPLIDKILCRGEQIARLENELADVKKELEIKKAEAPKPKRKYNKKKKADDKA
jgi:hypothetical protein